MTDKRLKSLMLEACGDIDAKKRREGLKKLNKQGNSATETRRTGIWALLRLETAHISPLYWLMQAAVLITLRMLGFDHTALFGAAPAVAVIGFCELTRCFGCGMWELEQSCKYDLRRLLLAKLAVTGCCDLCVLVAASCITGGDNALDGIIATTTVFSAANLLCLNVFSVCRDRSFRRYALAAAAIFAAAMTMIQPVTGIDLLERKFLLYWCLGLAVFATMLCVKLKKTFDTEAEQWSS